MNGKEIGKLLRFNASSTDESTYIDHLLKSKSSTDESYPLKNNSSVDKKTLKNLNKKYGPINKNFVKEESNSSGTNENVNTGHPSNRILKKKLDAIEDKPAEGKKKRNNRNDKIGVNKHKNYALMLLALGKLEVNVVVLIIYRQTVKLCKLLPLPFLCHLLLICICLL